MAEELLGCRRGIILSIFFYVNLSQQIHHISAQIFLNYTCTNTIGNYTPDSLFHRNLNNIITLSAANIDLPRSFTLGKGVDQVREISFCWRYLKFGAPNWCRECILDAANNLTKVCPNQKEAIGWNDDCMFRYSNNSIIGNMSLTPYYKKKNSTGATNPYWFSQNLTSLAGRLLVEASKENSNYSKYASENISTPDGETIFGAMQCTYDISYNDCKSCLNHTRNELLSCCDKVVGARYQTPSCAFRFEIYPFYQIQTAFFNYSDTGMGNKSKKIKIVVGAIVALLVLTLSLCVFIIRRRWQKTNTGHNGEEDEELLKNIHTETTQYDFASIRTATEGFSTANKLGRGGFGEVYKGVLSDGKEIAVKRLSTTSGQGDKEFKNEVLLLTRLQHMCLVKLLGFCLEQKERLLVYEFMANGSLDKVLFDLENRSRLDWDGRYKIIKSIARGLLYLHEDSRLMIIHRDLKTSNILLDGDMNAKISDFGMARLFERDEGEVITKRIAGTFGYMAPEYAMHGLFSVKSDVYSYGVMLLEILSGKRNYYSLTEDSSEGLLSYAYKIWKEGKAFDLIDPMLTAGSEYSLENMMRCIHMVSEFEIVPKKWGPGLGEEDEELLKNIHTETTQYDFASIRTATEGFSTANKLGRGGFGEVYKGVLSDGKEIAVKRLSTTSGQGDKEFKNEVLLLTRLQHMCLVKLLGFCLEQKERLLVYEFMANWSLDKVLFDLENRSRLDWDGRYKIIKSIARGLLYLHEDSRLMIIHRDLKTSNILLDGDMNAKISDFGMARLFERDEGEVITKRIAGTFGYMAPEYAMHGLFSVKSDVYSYGVMLLEILSGKRNYYSLTEDSSEGLLSYAYKIWKEGKAFDLIDPMLTAGSEYSLENMMRCIHIALLCVQDNVGSRPTMALVNLMLQSLTITLPIPFAPGFFNNSTSRSCLSELPESTAHYDPMSNEETDSYLYPR